MTKPIAAGTRVRAYRTSKADALWFFDPATGDIAKPSAFSMQPYVWGTIRQHYADLGCYDITVIREGREVYLSCLNRYWVKRWWQLGPRFPAGAKPRNVRPITKH